MQQKFENGHPTARQIGSVQVDFAALTINGPDGIASLEPKVMAVLEALAAKAPSVVSRETLISLVWGSESGGDESLSRAISLLRKALGDRRGEYTYIQTIPRRGYRLVADLAEPAQESARATSSAAGGRRSFWLVSAVALICLLLALAFTLRKSDNTASARASLDRSVAVLPFSDLSPAGDQAYFADGLAEEILNALTKIPELKVAGRTSTFAYRRGKDGGKDIDLRQLGSDLGVSHVLEGSVRKEGDELRITAQLVRTDNGFHSWSRSFDGNLDRVFDFQEEIARDIASALQVTLEPAESNRLAPALTNSQPAYDAFLQGRSLGRRFGPDDKLRAAELLEQAVLFDPGFALAWAELARTELFIPVSHPDVAPEPHIARARDAVDRALTIDPDLAMGHFVRGLVQESELRYADAFESFRNAYKLDPRSPFLAIRYGYYLALIGQTEAGTELMTQGLRLDPTDAAGIGNLGVAKLAAGDVEEARRLMQRSYDLGFAPLTGFLASVLAHSGQTEEALKLWRESRITLPGRFLPDLETPEKWEELGRLLYAGDTEGLEFVEQTLSDYLSNPDARVNSYRLYLLVQMGHPAEAMRLLLERPYPINASLIFAIWLDIDGFKELRQHEDFPQFAEQIGLVKAWDTYGWPPKCQRIPHLNEGDAEFRCD